MHEYTALQVQPVYQRLRAWQEGHVQILAGQAVVAETSRPVLLIETCVAPDPEAAAIAGHVAAAGQPGVQIIIDGTPERQP